MNGRGGLRSIRNRRSLWFNRCLLAAAPRQLGFQQLHPQL
jgi:hypothetical protein